MPDLFTTLPPKKALIPTEDDECKALVFYLETLMDEGKVIQYTHIPNETYTKFWSVKRRNRLLGVRSGFPDYVIVLAAQPRPDFPVEHPKVIYIEMKRTKGGTLSPEQKKWLEALRATGAVAECCLGFEQARALLDQHIPT